MNAIPLKTRWWSSARRRSSDVTLRIRRSRRCRRCCCSSRFSAANDIAAALVDIRDACHWQRCSTIREAIGALGTTAASVAGDGSGGCLLDPRLDRPGRFVAACPFAWREADDERDTGEDEHSDAGGQSGDETL